MKTKIIVHAAITLFVIIGFLETNNEKNKKSGTDTFMLEKEPETFIEAGYYLTPDDTSAILKAFFTEGEIIDTNLIRWKPDLEEKLKMNVSKDGFCYTILDTLLPLDEINEEYLFIFKTFVYDSKLKLVTCHSCAPNYSIGRALSTKMYKADITDFSKNVLTTGSLGEQVQLEIMIAGSSKKLLKITSANRGSDELNEVVHLIDIDKLNASIHYTALKSNENILNDPYQTNNGLYKKETELTTQYGKTGLYDIILSERETSVDSTGERIITKYSTKVYRWNEEEELELCYE